MELGKRRTVLPRYSLRATACATCLCHVGELVGDGQLVARAAEVGGQHRVPQAHEAEVDSLAGELAIVTFVFVISFAIDGFGLRDDPVGKVTSLGSSSTETDDVDVHGLGFVKSFCLLRHVQHHPINPRWPRVVAAHVVHVQRVAAGQVVK